jgi:predicted transposase YbfD/YdcC
VKTQIRSPFPFLTQIPDSRKPSRIKHSQATYWKLILLGLCCGCKNILAIHQWLTDNQQMLLEDFEIRNTQGQAVLPSQASLYRFLWQVETSLQNFEQQMLCWVKEVLSQLDLGKTMIAIGLDGKFLLGSKRPRAEQGSYVLLGAFIGALGMMLCQQTVQGGESKTAKEMLPVLQDLLSGLPWLVTMDAGVSEQELGRKIVYAGGEYLMKIKANQPDAFDCMRWIFSYPIAQTGTHSLETQRRSGEAWTWAVKTCNQLPEDLKTAFPDAQQAICLERTIQKFNGQVVREIEYSISSQELSAQQAYEYGRGHWGIENRSHHKRDTVFAEDACRTRLAARVLAGVRNALLTMLHFDKQPVLRQVRRFAVHPREAIAFLGLAS